MANRARTYELACDREHLEWEAGCWSRFRPGSHRSAAVAQRHTVHYGRLLSPGAE